MATGFADASRTDDCGPETTIHLADILGSFSYALNLTEGQPLGHSIRAARMGVEIGRSLGLARADLHELHYSVLLKDLGCSSNAARIAQTYMIDDRAFKRDYKLVDGGLPGTLAFVFGNTARGEPPLTRMRAIGNILLNGKTIARELIELRCDMGARIAKKLRFSDRVSNAIRCLDEHWDGSGKPRGLAGEAIPLFSRIGLLAQVADVHATASGRAAARDAVLARSGSWLDPKLSRVFDSLSKDDMFWTMVGGGEAGGDCPDIDPAGIDIVVDEDFMDEIASAFGLVIDAKSPFTGGHSARVGEMARRVAVRLDRTPADVRRLRRGAMLHDLGKLGISSAILEKKDPLSAAEWHALQGHAALTTAILDRVRCFGPMAAHAGAHHERLDGKGYPHRLSADAISPETRVITVCDFFDALSVDRPYRDGVSPDEALETMAPYAGPALDPDCFDALRQEVALGPPDISRSFHDEDRAEEPVVMDYRL